MKPGSPEHRLASVPKRQRSPVWNREMLKAEYMLDEFEEVASFFKARHPEIPRATFEKWKVGEWRTERRAYVAKAAEKAIQKAMEKRAKMLERHTTIGQAISKVAIEGLMDTSTGKTKLEPKTAEEAARMAKIGAEIEAKALEMSERGGRGGIQSPGVVIQQNGVAEGGQIVINIPANGFEHYDAEVPE